MSEPTFVEVWARLLRATLGEERIPSLDELIGAEPPKKARPERAAKPKVSRYPGGHCTRLAPVRRNEPVALACKPLSVGDYFATQVRKWAGAGKVVHDQAAAQYVIHKDDGSSVVVTYEELAAHCGVPMGAVKL